MCESALKGVKHHGPIKQAISRFTQIIGGLTTWGNHLDHPCCWLSEKLLLSGIATFCNRVAGMGHSAFLDISPATLGISGDPEV